MSKTMSRTKAGTPYQIAVQLAVAALYFGAARLGLSLAFLNASVSPVWPPTGVAIAAVVLFGYRVLPAVLVGAFLANLATGLPIATAAGIAIGNTLEAATASYLLHRFVRARNPFNRAIDVLKFAVVAGVVSTAVAATVGNIMLCLSGSANWTHFWSLWLTWWLGDGAGALMVAPFFITWADPPVERWPTARWAEAGALFLSVSFIAVLIFGGVILYRTPVGHLTIPVMLWAAFRLGPRGVATTIPVLSGIATWGTTRGFGPFVTNSQNESLLLLQVFVAVIAITFLAVAAIVTERKLAEEKLRASEERFRNAYEQAESASQIKDEFLATLSHELRTPLNAMLGWARILQSSNLDKETAKHAVETIHRNARVQAQLIDDLLDVSRIISGKLHLELQPLEIAPAIQAAIDVVQPAASAKGIRLEISIDHTAGRVSADPDRLQQVLWNLLHNAVKFTPAGGSVHVSVELIDSSVRIAVRDTGQGIAPEFLPHVFDRFRQADSSTTRLYGGLGLGLGIVRSLVELHGGSVAATSDGKGKGSTFTVTLTHLTDQDTGRYRTEVILLQSSRKEDLTPEASPLLTGLRLLVVDDEPDGRELVVVMLKRCGAEVTAVATAAEALDTIGQWRPDVLISDIEMPGEDGYALINKIRSSELKGTRLPAVALTAHARDEDRVRALDAGYQAHVAKPVSLADLANAIGRVTATY
jgi:signal transduction histidine kinase/CheY-like chemotaxis protein